MADINHRWAVSNTPERARSAISPSTTAPQPATSPTPSAETQPERPLAPTESSHTPERTGTAVLDRDPATTRSDPAASRELFQSQAATARRLTGGSAFPTADEQPRVPATAPRSASWPDLEGLSPTSTQTLEDGSTEETFTVDGVSYARTRMADGSVRTTYEQTGEDGSTFSASHTLRTDGSAQSRTERLSTTDQPLESLVSSPATPPSVSNVVALPQDGRGPTQVREVEVHDIDPEGQSELQYSEQTYFQDAPLKPGPEGQTFIPPFSQAAEGSRLTHTVSRIRARDDCGNLLDSTGASQTVVLAGESLPERGVSGPVSVTRTDSWNSAGESALEVSYQGFTRDESEMFDKGERNQYGIFMARAGDQSVTAGSPAERSFDAHLSAKGEGEVERWFDFGEHAALNTTYRSSRDANGNATSEEFVYSTVDENGNGRTAVRADSQGSVGWTYTDFSNNGQDFRRQRVFEGTDVSIYDSHETVAPGQFRSLSETRDGDQVLATSAASRLELDEQGVRDLQQEGRLGREQVEAIVANGPPYMVESLQQSLAPLVDEQGALRLEDLGNPIQNGQNTSSLTVATGNGYTLSESFQQNRRPDRQLDSDARVTTVYDPQAQDSAVLTTRAVTREYPPDGPVTTEDSGLIAVDANGEVRLEGSEQPVARYLLPEGGLEAFMRPSRSGAGGLSALAMPLSQLVGGAGKLKDHVGPGLQWLAGDDGPLDRLGVVGKALAVPIGIGQIFSGVVDGDAHSLVKGIGNAAGGLHSLAAAGAGLAGQGAFGSALARAAELTRLGSTAGRLLGAVGGGLTYGLGLIDIWNAETDADRVGAGISALGGGVGMVGALFGPPGWLVGGLASAGIGLLGGLVSGSDDNRTALMDGRLACLPG